MKLEYYLIPKIIFPYVRFLSQVISKNKEKVRYFYLTNFQLLTHNNFKQN